jgi:hypothetical protein
VRGKLSQLNHKTLSKIPNPKGVAKVEHEEWSGDYGIATYVGYTIIDSKLDVQRYYRTVRTVT